MLIFLKSSYIKPNVDPSSFISSEVCQSCVIKSDNFRFLKSSSLIPDFILRLKGGCDKFELTDEKQERLVKSILSKVPESNYQEISINKYLRKTLKLMDPILSDQRLWIIVTEFSKPLPARLGKPVLVRPELPDPEISQIRSPGLTLHKKTETKSETIFVEGLNILDRPKMLSPMQKEFS